MSMILLLAGLSIDILKLGNLELYLSFINYFKWDLWSLRLSFYVISDT